MNRLSSTSRKCLSVLLFYAMVVPPIAHAAPKPLTPAAVHQKLLKRGIGNWVGVQMDTGVVLVGRIVSIDEQSFSLQLHNDPEITPLQYTNVVGLQTGPSRATVWTILGVGIGGMVAVALVAHHEMSNMPKLPTQPVLPQPSPAF